MRGNLRIWGIVCGAAVLAILAGGWFLGVQPQLAAAATAATATIGMNSQNQTTRTTLVALTKEAAKTDTLQAQNAVLMKAVPEILKPNTFIRRINTVAALDGVTVQSVSPGDATAYTVPLAPPAVAGTPAAPVLAKIDPTITTTNFAVVPVTVVVSGSEDAVVQFTHDMQHDERLFLVTSLQTTKNDSNVVSATIAGSIYTLQR